MILLIDVMYLMITEHMENEAKIDFDQMIYAESDTNFGSTSSKVDRIMFASRLGGM